MEPNSVSISGIWKYPQASMLKNPNCPNAPVVQPVCHLLLCAIPL